jgi:hypothetical protein
VAPGHLLTQAGETCEHTRVQLHSKTQGGLVQNPLLDQLREPVASVVDGALHRAERRPHSQLLLHPRRAHPRKAPHWRAKAPSQKSPPHPIGKVTGHYPPKVFLKRRRRRPPPPDPAHGHLRITTAALAGESAVSEIATTPNRKGDWSLPAKSLFETKTTPAPPPDPAHGHLRITTEELCEHTTIQLRAELFLLAFQPAAARLLPKSSFRQAQTVARELSSALMPARPARPKCSRPW